MLASLINAIGVIAAAIIGTLCKNRVREKYTTALVTALAIVVGVLGVTYAIKTEDTLGMILCLTAGTLVGEWARIEDRLEALGDRLKKRFEKPSEKSTFTQGFVAASLLFCIGPMAVIGSIQAGTTGDMTIILSKTVIDTVTALSFAVALGIGVAFSGFSVLIYQGLLTLLAIWISPYLGDAVINEITAVGGVMMIGICINMLNLKKIRVGNMLPALFLPIFYQPFVNWLTSVF